MKKQKKQLGRRDFFKSSALLCSGALLLPEREKMTNGSCTALFIDLESFVQDVYSQVGREILVEGVRIKKNTKSSNERIGNNLVSYFTGMIIYNSSTRVFEGDMNQLFSDRHTIGQQPFNRKKADVLGLKLYSNGRFQFTLKTWGNYSKTFDVQCDGPVLYGNDPDDGFWAVQFVKRSYAL